MAPEPRHEGLIDRLSESRECHDSEGEIRVGRDLSRTGAEKVERQRPRERRAVGGDEPERRPGSQRPVRYASRLGETAVCALAARKERRGTRDGPSRTGGRAGKYRDGDRDEKPLHAHTTSVCTLRPCRSRTRRNSGPATSASTRLPSAWAMLKAIPATSTVTSAAHV